LPRRLSSFDQRTSWLKSAGANEVIRLTPTHEFLSQTPEQFITAIVAQHHPQFIVEGGDFQFGKGRAGSIDTLRHLESKHGYRTIIVNEVEAPLADHSLVRVGSTMIRWLLERGRVSDAASLLGRPYEMIARVVKGDQRGRELGVPTANLEHGEYVLPADGIYSGSATGPDARSYPAAISIGTKPTFGELPRVCEAHLIGFDGSLDEYNWTIHLRFDRWLRDQLKFAGIEPLIAQLKRDIEVAQRFGMPAQCGAHA